MSTSSKTVGRLAGVLLLLCLGGCGLTAPRSNAGYADFDSLGVFDTDVTMSLSLGPTVLRFAALHIDDDPELAHMLAHLEGVRVRTYQVNGDASRVAARIDHMSQRLQEQDWEPVISVIDADQRTRMLVKTCEDQILGLAVINSDGSEAVVVNIMGDLEPAFFDRAMAALDLQS